MEGKLLSVFGKQFLRQISTTAQVYGKRNFRKFPLYNKRGTRDFKKKQLTDPHPDVPIHHYGVRPTGYQVGKSFKVVPEMIPEIVVPDLTGFKLKPYVSYRVQDIIQPPMTPEELFGAVYVQKITQDYMAGKLDANGNPLEPSAEEKLTPEEAKEKALRIRTDIV